MKPKKDKEMKRCQIKDTYNNNNNTFRHGCVSFISIQRLSVFHISDTIKNNILVLGQKHMPTFSFLLFLQSSKNQ